MNEKNLKNLKTFLDKALDEAHQQALESGANVLEIVEGLPLIKRRMLEVKGVNPEEYEKWEESLNDESVEVPMGIYQDKGIEQKNKEFQDNLVQNIEERLGEGGSDKSQRVNDLEETIIGMKKEEMVKRIKSALKERNKQLKEVSRTDFADPEKRFEIEDRMKKSDNGYLKIGESITKLTGFKINQDKEGFMTLDKAEIESSPVEEFAENETSNETPNED